MVNKQVRVTKIAVALDLVFYFLNAGTKTLNKSFSNDIIYVRKRKIYFMF